MSAARRMTDGQLLTAIGQQTRKLTRLGASGPGAAMLASATSVYLRELADEAERRGLDT